MISLWMPNWPKFRTARESSLNGFSRRELLAVFVAAPAASAEAPLPIRRALNRLYNFDFAGANRILDEQIRTDAGNPTPFVFRAASLLFQELDRLGILEGEFFSDDERIAEKRKLKADPAIQRQFYEYVEMAQQRARHRLATDPKDALSLFALCTAAGLLTDYTALVEKRQLASFRYFRESHHYAVQLLRLDPSFTDAYMTMGLTEYVLGSVPFFIRWFVQFEGAEGDKRAAEANLKRVVASGRYLGPFAKILLSILYLREKRQKECEALLGELAREYPENPLFRRELEKVRAKGLRIR